MGGPSEEAEVSRRTGAAIAEALESKGYNAQTLELNPRTVLKDIESLGGEVVFNAIHGRYGEDGALQGLLRNGRNSIYWIRHHGSCCRNE